jgi:short-subunit dehydrogenase
MQEEPEESLQQKLCLGTPYLKETHGWTVNLSSLGGMLAIPFNTSYIASKFAVIGFSDSLRIEVKKAGVSVTVICSSLVVSEFHERFFLARMESQRDLRDGRSTTRGK